MKATRMSYQTAVNILFTAWKEVKGARGFFWLTALVALVIALILGICKELPFPMPILLLLTIVPSFISAYIGIGVLFVSEQWKEEKTKSLDNLFVFLTEKKRFLRFLPFAVIAVGMSILGIVILPEKMPRGAELSYALTVIILMTLSTINWFAGALNTFESLSLMESFKQSVMGILKNIDTLIVYGIVAALFTAVSVIFTLGIILIFLIPVLMYIGYVLFRSIFPKQIETNPL